MSNIIKADCGFDPHDMDNFKDVKASDLIAEDGFDLRTWLLICLLKVLMLLLQISIA